MTDKFYKYYNPNPEGNEDAADCVVRALCAVTGLSWYEVYDKCCAIAREHCVMPSCGGKKFSTLRAEAFGLVPRVVPKTKKGERALSVQDFCRKYKKGKYILTTSRHNVAVVDGKYYDTFENRGQKVYKFYEMVGDSSEK